MFADLLNGQFPNSISNFQFPGTRTGYGCLSNFNGRPAFCGRRMRPAVRSSSPTKTAFPNGQPVRTCSRKSRNSSSRIALSSSLCQLATDAFSQRCWRWLLTVRPIFRSNNLAFRLRNRRSQVRVLSPKGQKTTRHVQDVYSAPPGDTTRPARRCSGRFSGLCQND